MEKELVGIIAALLTPFTAKGKVDFPALEREIEYTVGPAQANAVSVAAVETSEYQVLSMEERKELIREAIRLVRGRLPVIVGITHPSFQTAVDLARYAEDQGSDFLQVLVPLRPWGGSPSHREFVRYFEELTRRIELPLVVYINPGPGADLPVPATLEIAALDKVHAFKESSRNLRRVSRLLAEIPRAGRARYFTTMEMLLITLILGGPGATMPPPAVKIGADIVSAFRRGDLAAAAELQQRFSLFPSRWMGKGLAPVMKAAMKIVGVDLGDPVPPFEALDDGEMESLDRYLKEIKLTG